MKSRSLKEKILGHSTSAVKINVQHSTYIGQVKAREFERFCIYINNK